MDIDSDVESSYDDIAQNIETVLQLIEGDSTSDEPVWLSDLEIPKQDLEKLSDADKVEFTKQLSGVTVNALGLLARMSTMFDDKTPLLKDVEIDFTEAVGERFTRIGVWQFISRMNKQLKRNMDGFVAGVEKEQESSERTFLDTYRELMAEDFKEDLDKVAKSMGSSDELTQAEFNRLVDTVQSGASMFSSQDRMFLFPKGEDNDEPTDMDTT
eukprot:CAMPEP_0168535488 /NCGR_PEP_ID=MMETSP0405-20121227/18752_1 /TAXON_ID=498012 /ORGANISM="Trichosphaerium sp, Strain Am-I-7 wt" /LENGTH=212 /DNA_ID=CAMNT_0008562849 /DNA_START=892 /DNA_END=1530 /DNA_ORIENTATION=-